MPKATEGTAIQFDGQRLRCVSDAAGERWSFAVAELLLVAEYTTDEGPYADDYFLIFLFGTGGGLGRAQCSMGAQGCIEAMDALAGHLGSAMLYRLPGSTRWASNVLWPPVLAGTEFYTFSELPTDSLGARIRRMLLGGEQEYRISQPVRDYLARLLAPSNG